jgi:hypothetical protein
MGFNLAFKGLRSIAWSHKKLSLAKKLGSVIQLNAPATKEKAFGNRLADMYYTYIYILKKFKSFWKLFCVFK